MYFWTKNLFLYKFIFFLLKLHWSASVHFFICLVSKCPGGQLSGKHLSGEQLSVLHIAESPDSDVPHPYLIWT